VQRVQNLLDSLANSIWRPVAAHHNASFWPLAGFNAFQSFWLVDTRSCSRSARRESVAKEIERPPAAVELTARQASPGGGATFSGEQRDGRVCGGPGARFPSSEGIDGARLAITRWQTVGGARPRGRRLLERDELMSKSPVWCTQESSLSSLSLNAELVCCTSCVVRQLASLVRAVRSESLANSRNPGI